MAFVEDGVIGLEGEMGELPDRADSISNAATQQCSAIERQRDLTASLNSALETTGSSSVSVI